MRLTWQTSQLIGLAVVSMLMTLISPADAGSVTNRIDGFQVPQIVSDSVTAEFAGLLDRLGVIATTTGFFEALIAPVCILVALAGLRAIGARTSKRATRTRPDNVFKFEPRARSLKRMPSRTNEFRNVSLNAVGVILIAGFFALSNTSVQADTKKVQVPANKATLIDIMSALGSDTRSQLATDPKIRSQTKNGRIIIEIVKVKVPDGSCRGQTVQVIAIGYQPKRGFRGKDEGSVSRRRPPRRYHEREVALTQTRKYIITVK